MSGGQIMAAIFGPGQNMADTFSLGRQNVAARFRPTCTCTLQYGQGTGFTAHDLPRTGHSPGWIVCGGSSPP